MIPLLSNFAPLAARYDGFIVDLWGVIHDGITPFPGALECLSNLIGRPLLLLSNAPRRASSVRGTLRGLGVGGGLYRHILTSGEATWMALSEQTDPWFASLGPRAYHLGPERDRGLLDDLNLILAHEPAQADFILNTGPDDERDTAGIAEFADELEACLTSGLPMVCANPDLEIVRGNARILCAGALATWYEERGGDVRWIGKPDPAIYRQALTMIGLQPDRVLAIGDSLRTDIAGAKAAGIDSLWILGGIHANELAQDPSATAQSAGLAPVGMMHKWAW